MRPLPHQINVELARLLGLDITGLEGFDVEVRTGAYPKVTERRQVHGPLGQMGTTLRSRSFDLVPRCDPAKAPLGPIGESGPPGPVVLGIDVSDRSDYFSIGYALLSVDEARQKLSDKARAR